MYLNLHMLQGGVQSTQRWLVEVKAVKYLFGTSKIIQTRLKAFVLQVMQKNLEKRTTRAYFTAVFANKLVLLHYLREMFEKMIFWKTGVMIGRCHEIRSKNKKIVKILKCKMEMKAKKTRSQKLKINRKIIKLFRGSQKIFKVISTTQNRTKRNLVQLRVKWLQKAMQIVLKIYVLSQVLKTYCAVLGQIDSC